MRPAVWTAAFSMLMVPNHGVVEVQLVHVKALSGFLGRAEFGGRLVSLDITLDILLCGIYTERLKTPFLQEQMMSHKKRERAKELDRRRHRREDRLKQRIRTAKAATKAKA